MDLHQFFPSVRAPRVYGLFKTAGYGKVTARILTGLCTTSADGSTIAALRELSTSGQSLHQLYAHRHLPQGAPTSPALANLCAYRLDCRLAGLAEKLNGRYTRYADDLLFSFAGFQTRDRQSRNRMRRFAHGVAVIAIEEGFDINFRKTRIMPQSQRQLAAGVVFNRKPNVPRAYFDRLKATLYNCVTTGPETQNIDSHPDFRAHLAGRIEWVRQLNPVKCKRLDRLFERIQWARL